jgi:hypothetical protein
MWNPGLVFSVCATLALEAWLFTPPAEPEGIIEIKCKKNIFLPVHCLIHL